MTDITHDELVTLRAELFRDDVYRATRVFDGSQLWLDVGCHVGLFSTLAEAYGATVIGGVDANPLMVDAYMDRHPQPAVLATITHVDDILAVLAQFGDAAQHVNALKMDVQGSEVGILTSVGQMHRLAAQFDTLLFEYHQPASLGVLLHALGDAGYRIDFIDATTDTILVGQDTFIVHARRPEANA